MASKAEALKAKKLRAMIDEDYHQGPPSDGQQGEMDGDKIYNDNVDSVNRVAKTGEALRHKYSDETMAQIEADRAALEAEDSEYNKGKLARAMKKKGK